MYIYAYMYTHKHKLSHSHTHKSLCTSLINTDILAAICVFSCSTAGLVSAPTCVCVLMCKFACVCVCVCARARARARACMHIERAKFTLI